MAPRLPHDIANMGQIKWKTDDRGRRRLPASYIMRRDPRAKAAFRAMRRRGMTQADAEREIEAVAEKGFYETLFFNIDRRPELWISLEEGLRAADLFTDIQQYMDAKRGEGDEIVHRIRHEKRDFIVGPARDNAEIEPQVYVNVVTNDPHYILPGGVITLEAAQKYDGCKVEDAFWGEFLAENWLEIVEGQPALAATGQLRSFYIEGDTVKLAT